MIAVNCFNKISDLKLYFCHFLVLLLFSVTLEHPKVAQYLSFAFRKSVYVFL